MRRALALASLAAVFAMPSSAQACTCLPPDAEEIFARSDAAFIGILKSVRILDESQPLNSKAIFRYRVRRAYGAELGRYVRVASGSSSAICGLPQETNRKYAMGIDGRRGSWTSGSCLEVDPRDLREAAAGTERAGPGDGGCASAPSAA